MKKEKITKAYLSLSSPGVYLAIPSKAATRKAIGLARRVNQYASQLKAVYPEKFGFFASLPLPDVEASLQEIEYCFTQLHPKPDGILLLSNYYGMYLGDAALDPVYEALNKLNVTIFEHPTTPCTEYNYLKYHTKGRSPAISQKQWQARNRPVTTRQPATPLLDFSFETARTVVDLLISDVPSRFSALKWIIPHAGGGLIPTLDRLIRYGLKFYPNLNLTEPFVKETLANGFYFDLAGPWSTTSAVPSLLYWVDYTNILWGSDTPFTPWALAANLIIEFDRGSEVVLHNSSEAEAIRRGNALKLLH